VELRPPIFSRPPIPQCGAFTRELERLHPDNRHVRDKIRQQLQVLPSPLRFRLHLISAGQVDATRRDLGFLLHVVRLLPHCGFPPSLGFGAASRRDKSAVSGGLKSQGTLDVTHQAQGSLDLKLILDFGHPRCGQGGPLGLLPLGITANVAAQHCLVSRNLHLDLPGIQQSVAFER